MSADFEILQAARAVWIRDDLGILVAGSSISAAADRLPEEWGEDLINTAAQISLALGFADTPPKD